MKRRRLLSIYRFDLQVRQHRSPFCYRFEKIELQQASIKLDVTEILWKIQSHEYWRRYLVSKSTKFLSLSSPQKIFNFKGGKEDIIYRFWSTGPPALVEYTTTRVKKGFSPSAGIIASEKDLSIIMYKLNRPSYERNPYTSQKTYYDV